VELTDEQVGELWAVANSRDVPAVVVLRARVVLWMGEGRRRNGVPHVFRTVDFGFFYAAAWDFR